MPGKKRANPDMSRDDDIAQMKEQVLSFFETTGMKTAAANFVGRDIQTIRDWEAADENFRIDMLRAQAKFAKVNQRKVKIDNLFANLYPEDFKPPKQEIDQTGVTSVTINHVHPDDKHPSDTQAGRSLVLPRRRCHH
jgi:hypothetical protein